MKKITPERFEQIMKTLEESIEFLKWCKGSK